MASRTIGADVRLGGEAAFNTAMTNISSTLRALNAELKATEAGFGGQESGMNKNQQSMTKLQEIYAKQAEKIDLIKKKMQEMRDAGQENSTNYDKLRTSLANAEVALGNTKAAMEALGESATMSAMGTLELSAAMETISGVSDKVMSFFKDTVQSSADFEASMAAVSRTTGVTGKELTDMGEEFKSLSTRIPVSANALAGIAKTAGQLGVAGDNVMQFTETVAMLATTTEMSTDEAATMMAQFGNITGNKNYEQLASAIAVLGDSTATTAQKTLDMATGFAAVATTAGFSADEILSIAAATGGLGIEAAAGGTSLSRLIQQLNKAVGTGNNLQKWAQVAGMSAAEFKVAWGTDAAGALVAFMQGMKDCVDNGENMSLMLEDLGITSQREIQAVQGLANSADILSETMAAGNAAYNENVGLSEKANTMYTTTAATMEKFNNSVDNFKVAVGNALAPSIGTLLENGSGLLGILQQLVAENPAIVEMLAAMTTGLGATAAAMGTYTLAAKAATAIGLTGPIGLAAMAVTGLGAAFVSSKRSTEEYYEEMAGEPQTIEEVEAALTKLRAEQQRWIDFQNANPAESIGFTDTAIEEQIAVLEEKRHALNMLNKAENVYGISEAGNEGPEQLAGRIDVLTTSIEDLNQAYMDCYTSARESLEGQFGLFDEVGEATGQSIEKMLSGMASQTDFYTTYADNLNGLMSLTTEGIGLNTELIQTLADGSTESAAYAQALMDGYNAAAAESPEAAAAWVDEINTAFTDRQTALDETAAAIAAAQTDYENSFAAILDAEAAGVADMNMAGEMASAAADTVAGFVNEINSGSGAVSAAMSALAANALAAFKNGLGIASPSKKMAEAAVWTAAGFTEEIKAQEKEVAQSMGGLANAAMGGFDVSQISAAGVPAAVPVAGGVTINTTINAPEIDKDTIDYVVNKVNGELGGMV